MSARRRFRHPYKECFVLLPNQCRISQSTPFGTSVLTGTLPNIHPLQGLAPLLAHHLVSGSDTICNSSSPLLADIVFFGLSLSGLPQGFKTRLLGGGFHTLIKNISFSSLANVGSHNPPPSGSSVLAGTCSPLQLM